MSGIKYLDTAFVDIKALALLGNVPSVPEHILYALEGKKRFRDFLLKVFRPGRRIYLRG